MKQQIKNAADWNAKFGLPVAMTPRRLSQDEISLIFKLVYEELVEWKDAAEEGDHVASLDGLCDIMYHIHVAAVRSGLGTVLEAGMNEIHRSNTSKLGDDGKPVLRADGKILKGENYFKPDLLPIVSAIIPSTYENSNIN